MSNESLAGSLSPRVPFQQGQRHEAIFLSDIHLGTRSCQAKLLLAFLEQVDTRELFLVGDIIDFWNLSTLNHYWSKSHTKVVMAFIKMAKRGVKVTYVPGNHDELLREIAPVGIPGFQVVSEVIFEIKNKRYLLIHGDAFDHMLKIAKLLSKVGAILYDFLVRFNHFYNAIRKLLRKPYWSLSMYLKHRAKEAVGMMKEFEALALSYALSKGCNGVICGHIHNPVADPERGYFNCGDGVENLTYIGVTTDGVFYLGTYENLGQPSESSTENSDHAR